MPRTIPPASLLDHYLLDPTFALHTAARHGNITLIKELTAAGHAPNTLEPFTYGTPLHVAIACDQLPSVLTLLLCGADAEAFTPNHFRIDTGHTGDNSLRMAVRWGRREIVKVLWDLAVRRDALNEKDARYAAGPWGRRLPGLLEIAAWEGHADVVGDLLEWSDDWVIEEREGAVVKAAWVWDFEIVGILLVKYGKEAFSKDVLKEALTAAVENGPRTDSQVRPPGFNNTGWMELNSMAEAMTIKLLLDIGLDVDFGQLLCKVSFRPCEIEAMRMLLKRGADVMTRDEYGRTPLHIASKTEMRSLDTRNANVEGIKVLVDHDADPYAVDDEGHTPLHSLAARRMNASNFLYCVKHGKMPLDGRLPRNEHGESILHEVCANFHDRRCEMVEALLDAGFDVNEATLTGWTPLICAINPGQDLLRISQILFSRGADVTAATDCGWTALHRVAELHLDHDDAPTLADDLITRGADVAALAVVPENPMERRMSWGHEFGEKYQNGSGKDARTVVSMRTALHGAAERGALPIIRVLLKHEADPFMMDGAGSVPAVLVAWSKDNYMSSSRTEVLKVLLHAGPETFEWPNANGQSVSNWVKREGYSENWRLWW